MAVGKLGARFQDLLCSDWIGVEPLRAVHRLSGVGDLPAAPTTHLVAEELGPAEPKKADGALANRAAVGPPVVHTGGDFRACGTMTARVAPVTVEIC